MTLDLKVMYHTRQYLLIYCKGLTDFKFSTILYYKIVDRKEDCDVSIESNDEGAFRWRDTRFNCAR